MFLSGYGSIPLFLDTIPGIDPGPLDPGTFPGDEPGADPYPDPDPDPAPESPGISPGVDPGYPVPSIPGGPSPIFT
ncbi:hypothetical protein [Acidipila sp. EB88]|uniref:hypothetical protein n=1 Tax=Acidipila sp. EB88 TaxID=2305226 RepID=UPI000F5E3EED|nr:hypothetical protein [Acidipila sp. EB88]RRA48953.1 hypothetical protein D1Y84_12380 [Acidipila sp. EB88]